VSRYHAAREKASYARPTRPGLGGGGYVGFGGSSVGLGGVCAKVVWGGGLFGGFWGGGGGKDQQNLFGPISSPDPPASAPHSPAEPKT